MAKPPEGPAAGAPTAWTSYVTVDDVDACTAKVAGAGGLVLAGPMDIPTVGRMAIVLTQPAVSSGSSSTRRRRHSPARSLHS